MSENVSSNVLFHFTRSMGAIESILRDGFFPHYCPEYSLEHEDIESLADPAVLLLQDSLQQLQYTEKELLNRASFAVTPI